MLLVDIVFQHLRAQIFYCKQEKSNTIVYYFNRFLELYDDLARFKHAHVFSAKIILVILLENILIIDHAEEKFHKFLISVDDYLYAYVRSNLLSQKSTPTLEKVFF